MDRWSQLSLKDKSDLMSLYIQNGIDSLEEIKKHYNSFATGGSMSPDHDPNNPYHYHTANGEKIVVTPEDWEKHYGQPYFKEIQDAVEAERAAYPEPEYDEIENPAWRRAYQNLVNGRSAINYQSKRNGAFDMQTPVPNGYTRDAKGVVVDNEGNYYTPVYFGGKTNPNAPYFINRERSIINGNVIDQRYERVDMPSKTIRTLRKPLPVDRTLNVYEERKKAINNYRNNEKVEEYYYQPYIEYLYPIGSVGEGYIHTITLSPNRVYIDDHGNLTTHVGKAFDAKPGSKPNVHFSDDSFGVKNKRITKSEYDKIYSILSDVLPYYDYLNGEDIKVSPRIANTGLHTSISKPTQEEAERNAVIEIGPLQKVDVGTNKRLR